MTDPSFKELAPQLWKNVKKRFLKWIWINEHKEEKGYLAGCLVGVIFGIFIWPVWYNIAEILETNSLWFITILFLMLGSMLCGLIFAILGRLIYVLCCWGQKVHRDALLEWRMKNNESNE